MKFFSSFVSVPAILSSSLRGCALELNILCTRSTFLSSHPYRCGENDGESGGERGIWGMREERGLGRKGRVRGREGGGKMNCDNFLCWCFYSNRSCFVYEATYTPIYGRGLCGH